MGERSRRFLATILTAVLFFAPGAAVAEEDDAALDCDKDGRVDDFEATQTACPDGDGSDGDDGLEKDCNKDGKVDDVEASQDHCPEMRDDADDHEMDGGLDCNKDGKVDDREATWDRCPDATTMREGEKLPCDLNGDGMVGPREKEACAERQAADEDEPPMRAPEGCDTDGDGALSEDEAEACREKFREKCDANDDGRVDEFERRKCAEANAEFRPQGVSDECRAELQAWDEERREFQETIKERHEAFEAERRAAFEDFSDENHTEEEWKEFHESWGEKRRAFDEGLRALHDDFESEHQAPEACKDVNAQHECAPDPEEYERFKSFVDEEDHRFRKEMEERIQRFKERQHDEAHEEGLDEEAAHDTDAEDAQADDVARFEQEMEEARLKHRAHLDRLWQEFKEKHAKDCLRGAGEKRAPEDLHEDVREERFACKLEFQAKIDAFREEHGDESTWDDEDRAAFEALMEEIGQLARECEKRLHEAWKEEAKAHFEERRGEERFGHFEVDSTGDGEGTVTGRFVAFEFEEGSLYLRDYTVQGLVLFDEFYAPHDVERPRAEGREIRILGTLGDEDCDDGDEDDACARDGMRARIHDNPTGRFDVACKGDNREDAESGDPANFWLRLPDGVEVEKLGATEAEDDEDGDWTKYALDYGDGQEAVLAVRGAHWWTDESTELEATCAFHLFLPAENFVHEFANKHREELNAAAADGALLAEIDVVVDEDGDASAASTEYEIDDEDSDEAEDEADEEDVEVEEPEEGDGVVVEFDSATSEGKTVVFNLDSDLFEVDDLALAAPDDFVVTYYEVAEDGTKTEVEIDEADSLGDVLDSDEEAPEYWIVLDKDGLQLLVSNPHFSTKQVQIQSASSGEGAGEGGDTPALGLLGAAAAVGVAAFAARRRK